MKTRWIYTARDTGERLAEKELSPEKETGTGFVFCVSGRKTAEDLWIRGAFTDTAAMALIPMEEAIREKAVAAYF